MTEPIYPRKLVGAPSNLYATAPIVLLVALIVMARILFHGDSAVGPSQVVLIVCALLTAVMVYKNGLILVSCGSQGSKPNTVWLLMSVVSLGAIADYPGTLRQVRQPFARLASGAHKLMVTAVEAGMLLNVSPRGQYATLTHPGVSVNEDTFSATLPERHTGASERILTRSPDRSYPGRRAACTYVRLSTTRRSPAAHAGFSASSIRSVRSPVG